MNNSGQTIWLKIVGHQLEATYTPDLDGVQTGLLFAAAPTNQDTADLEEGMRVVVIWNNLANVVHTGNVNINAPSTITIGPGFTINQAF
ncbi:MAG TPA: hypothetical protein VFA18_12600 [Gemmataceae bacterium]|nr:hypothetical protein [Gemmataceae bacterium]